MPDITEIIDDMTSHRLTKAEAYVLVGKLIQVGLDAAPFRKETVPKVCDILSERARRFMPKYEGQHEKTNSTAIGIIGREGPDAP